MNPYDYCWCRSGEKWKWCHKNREKQEPIQLDAVLNTLRAEAMNGYCSHPDAGAVNCSDRIILSHTVQRNGALSSIAEQGHVFSVLRAKMAADILIGRAKFEPRRVGVRSASTFMGFCNRHDTSMFLPIEIGSAGLNVESCFLLSFRALAYELFAKRYAIRVLSAQRKLDRGMTFPEQANFQQDIQDYEQGLQYGLRDLERLKSEYDAAFGAQDFTAFSLYGVAFSDILPVVACGGFYPEFDFNGLPLQKLVTSQFRYETCLFNLTVLDGRSVAVLGWIEGDNGPASAFAQSFALLPGPEKAEAAIRLAFEHLESTYMQPSWWDGLTPSSREAAIVRMNTGTTDPAFDRKTGCLKPDNHSYASGVTTVQIVTT